MEAEMAEESYSDCEEEECLIETSLIDDTFAAEYSSRTFLKLGLSGTAPFEE